MTGLPWVYSDGGRAQAPGFGGVKDSNDCAVRAIAVALGRPYESVYSDLTAAQFTWAHSSRSKAAVRIRTKKRWHARFGVETATIHYFLQGVYGWRWTPTMQIGSGATTHLAVGELPGGVLVANLSKHVCAVIDGVVYDTHDPCRSGTRCVYGYWSPM